MSQYRPDHSRQPETVLTAEQELFSNEARDGIYKALRSDAARIFERDSDGHSYQRAVVFELLEPIPEGEETTHPERKVVYTLLVSQTSNHISHEEVEQGEVKHPHIPAHPDSIDIQLIGPDNWLYDQMINCNFDGSVTTSHMVINPKPAMADSSWDTFLTALRREIGDTTETMMLPEDRWQIIHEMLTTTTNIFSNDRILQQYITAEKGSLLNMRQTVSIVKALNEDLTNLSQGVSIAIRDAISHTQGNGRAPLNPI